MGQKLVLKNILSDGVHLGKKVEPENLELFNSVIVTEEIKANDDSIIVSDDKKSDKVVPAKSAAGCSTEFPDTKKVDELLRSSKTLTKGTFKSHESGLLVCCIPCNTTITLGKEYKKLSNVYAHAGRLGHKNNVISYLEREKRKLANPSEVISSKKAKMDNEEIQKEMEIRYKELALKHGEKILSIDKKSRVIKCNYCTKLFKIWRRGIEQC